MYETNDLSPPERTLAAADIIGADRILEELLNWLPQSDIEDFNDTSFGGDGISNILSEDEEGAVE